MEEQYKEAYERAPQETKRAIEKFMSLPANVRANKPLLYYVLGSGTPSYKMSKRDSKYVDVAKGREKCSNCIFTYIKYVDNTPICSQIRGTIALGGWCKLWKGE